MLARERQVRLRSDSARSYGARVNSPCPSWVRHPVAVPLGVALLAVALLSGVTAVAIHESNRSVEQDAQARMRSNRDAAVRALVRSDRTTSSARWRPHR